MAGSRRKPPNSGAAQATAAICEQILELTQLTQRDTDAGRLYILTSPLRGPLRFCSFVSKNEPSPHRCSWGSAFKQELGFRAMVCQIPRAIYGVSASPCPVSSLRLLHLLADGHDSPQRRCLGSCGLRCDRGHLPRCCAGTGSPAPELLGQLRLLQVWPFLCREGWLHRQGLP